MPNLSRRGFLGLLKPAQEQAASFSLDRFYSKRGTPPSSLVVELRQGLPSVDTTQVGVPDLIPEESKRDDRR
ncbi:MAG: hypothetical protein KC766_05200 [Myxococcales bacterium]|nr:hypothetical protein [Myxococcales bacterium]